MLVVRGVPLEPVDDAGPVVRFHDEGAVVIQQGQDALQEVVRVRAVREDVAWP